MVKRAIKIKLIEKASARQVTFSKRKAGLFKKAHDLAVLCDAEVGVIVFTGQGELFKYASSSMVAVLERFDETCPAAEHAGNKSPRDTGIDCLSQFTEQVKAMQSNVIGDDLKRLSITDLLQVEQKIHASLGYIRSLKDKLLSDELKTMKPKVAEAQKVTDANSIVLGKVVDLGCL